MKSWLRGVSFALGVLFFAGAAYLAGQVSGGPQRGTLIVDGGGAIKPVMEEFVRLAGGPEANFVYIPTGASALKTPEGIIINPDWPRDRPDWADYEKSVLRTFGVNRITILHTRDRAVADSEPFVEPLRKANGVWLSPGNSGRLAAAYLDTRTHRELLALLGRGGVIGGSSAGAIIQGSYTVRGRPDKPLLMAEGHERGFAFLKNVAINPHLTSAKRDNELINVVDRYPHLLGIGIDDDAALVVQGDTFRVMGTGRVAIYDNQRHESGWYYWLNPGDRFDLKARRAISMAAANPSK